MRRWVSLGVLAAALAAGPLARADDTLARARALRDRLAYRDALRLLDEARARGNNRAVDMPALHFLSGELAAGVDAVEVALGHFRVALALDPTLSLPAGTSPKIAEPFGRARASLAGRRLRAELVPGVGGAREVVVVDPVGDLAAGVRAVVGAGDTLDLPGPRFVVPATAVVRRLEVVDRHGNALLDVASPAFAHAAPRTDVEPAPGPVLTVNAAAPSRAAPLWRRPLPWAIATGALAGATLATGLWAADAQSEVDDLTERARNQPFTVDFSELDDAQTRGDRLALATNLGLALTGAALAGTVVAWLWGAPDGPVENTVAPVAAGTSESLMFGVRGAF